MNSLWPNPALVLLAVTPPTGADSVEASLVARCANPVCARQLHELSQGRLYLLPPPGCAVNRLADHCYWLCANCSLHFALIRQEGDVVLLVRERSVTPPVQLLMSGRWDRSST